MKANVFKVLFLACLIFSGLIPFTAGTLPQSVSLLDFNGEWVFERAEILERRSLNQDFQVKQEITTAEGLEKLAPCMHQAVKRISISDIVHVICPFTLYCGRAVLVTVNDPKGDRYLLTIGTDTEELDKESPLSGVVFNIVGLDYWIERIDAKTIALTKEVVCSDNEVVTHSAVRCVMKKNN